MPRRKKKKKLFYLGMKNNGKHLAEESNKKKIKKEAETLQKKKIEEIKKQNKIEEKQKKNEEKERIKRIENKNKEIQKNKKKETKEEIKNNKYTNSKNNNEVFDFNEEVVKERKQNTASNIKSKTKKKTQKKKRKISLIMKCTTIIIILIGVIGFAMTSNNFAVKEIIVEGNTRLDKETIIQNSGITYGQNIFRININKTIENIKNNTYIKNVQVEKSLPTVLKINVEERAVAYMLECSENYIYIDGQGYLLELSNVALDLPIIIGIEESEENLLKIKRLNTKDLSKLNDILKITETLNGYELYENINKIEIKNNKEYIIHMDKIGKTVHIGDMTNLNNKILHLKKILDTIEGKTGTVYINGNLNNGFKPYFSEDI